MTAAWSIVVHRDGQPVTGPVPANAWEAASVLARVVVGMVGGPVSVAGAVHDAAPGPDPEAQLDIFHALDTTAEEATSHA